MTIKVVISELERLIRLHNSHKRETFVEQSGDFLISFESLQNFANLLEVEIFYGDKSKSYRISKTQNTILIPTEFLKYPGFDIQCKVSGRHTNKITIPLVKTNTLNKVENVDCADSIDKMYKYASICNQILKECKKIEENIKGGK